MHKMLIGFAIVASMAASSVPAAAQRRAPAPRVVQSRVPAAGMWAVGGSIGATAPNDDSLQNGLDLAGNIEHFFTPRFSLRGQIGASWWDIQGRHFGGQITPFFADANAVYNWEGGPIHPYVTGGLGLYRFHASESATQDRSDTEPGFNFGGGLDYFLNRRTTMGAELLYHKVGAFDTPLATFTDGSFWRFGFGLKRFF